MRLSYSKQTEPFSLMDSTNSDGLDSALVRVSVATDVKLKYLNVEMEMGHFIEFSTKFSSGICECKNSKQFMLNGNAYI